MFSGFVCLFLKHLANRIVLGAVNNLCNIDLRLFTFWLSFCHFDKGWIGLKSNFVLFIHEPRCAFSSAFCLGQIQMVVLHVCVVSVLCTSVLCQSMHISDCLKLMLLLLTS